MSALRTCPDCRRELPATATYFYAKGTRRDGSTRWDTYCRRCRRLRTRRRYDRLMANPETAAIQREKQRLLQAAARARRPERDRAARKRRWARIKADPDRLEAVNQRRRRYRREHYDEYLIAERMRAEREGRRLVSTAYDAYQPLPRGHSGPRLDAAPLAQWLRHEYPGMQPAQVASRLGVEESMIRRLVSGDQRVISLNIADRLFVAADCTHLLAVLYPDTG